MEQFESLVREFQKVVPFRIKYKDETPWMQNIFWLIRWFNPRFLSSFTSVLGSTIYYPSREYVEKNPWRAMRILSHEMVHLLDQQHFGKILFMLSYIFPQCLAVGVFSFPLIGWWSLLFLLFLAPIPSPTRFYFESRAYAMNLLTTSPENRLTVFRKVLKQFLGWNYYKMYPFEESVTTKLEYWMEKAEKGEDKILIKALLIYEVYE